MFTKSIYVFNNYFKINVRKGFIHFCINNNFLSYITYIRLQSLYNINYAQNNIQNAKHVQNYRLLTNFCICVDLLSKLSLLWQPLGNSINYCIYYGTTLHGGIQLHHHYSICTFKLPKVSLIVPGNATLDFVISYPFLCFFYVLNNNEYFLL